MLETQNVTELRLGDYALCCVVDQHWRAHHDEPARPVSRKRQQGKAAGPEPGIPLFSTPHRLPLRDQDIAGDHCIGSGVCQHRIHQLPTPEEGERISHSRQGGRQPVTLMKQPEQKRR
jgi:hypothetical protein